jgi:hypothetical protein
MKKIFILIFIAFSFLYASLNPQLFLGVKYSNDYANISTHKEIEYDFSSNLNDLSNLLQSIGFTDKKIDIFITENKFEYLFFSYGFLKKIFWVNSLNGKVILPPIEVKENKVYFKDMDNLDFRSELSKAAITAAIRLQRETLEYIFMDSWKISGYAQLFSGELPFYSDDSICGNISDENFLLFKNRIAVKYMIDFMHLKPKQIFNDNYSIDSVLSEAKKHYCK